VVAMGSLTFGAIEAVTAGLMAPGVLAAFALASLSIIAFVLAQARGAHPMVPLDMFGSRTFRIALGTGFAFMVGYYGLPFVFSLYLQSFRGLSAFETGVTFLPMMLVGLALTPFSARIVERYGARVPIAVGLLLMTLGLCALALMPVATPIWLLSVLMMLVGLGGPLTMPPITAVLLNHVSAQQTGTASGVFNTSRQAGGALSVAVFGALLANQAHFMSGLRSSLLIAAAVLLITTLGSLRLPGRHGAPETP
jgi:DHA2 family methylenomycin A resistance protein-like MFS transporter